MGRRKATTAVSDSHFVSKEICPSCNDRGCFARYSDGGGHCFGCGYHERHPTDELNTKTNRKAMKKEQKEFIRGERKALSKRSISQETCDKWGYETGEIDGEPVQIANYFRDGALVGQKIRKKNKQFSFRGDMEQAGLYGMHLWRDGGKKVVITEGEIDALTVSQLQGNKWPVVSVPNGANGAAKAIARELEWLEQFEEVVLMFDNDEPGNDAIAECVTLFSPGKCKVARLPLKDPNEMLTEGRGAEVIEAVWGAKLYRPDGIVSIGDLREKLTTPVTMGLSWPWDGLTKETYGIRRSELYALGAGTGMGKSELFKEVMVHLTQVHGLPVGGLFLEEQPDHTVRCLAGKIDSKLYHVPGQGWTIEDLLSTVDRMEAEGKVQLYDHFGHTDYDTIKARIRFMVVSLGIKDIFLDHITALVSGDRDGDERKILDYIMTDLASLVRELNFTLYFISHLATPEGKPHEEGGRVQVKHFRGSRAIGQWSSFMFGLERDQQEEDTELRKVTTLRILKDRYTGRATGKCIYLSYNTDTGRLSELSKNPFEDREKSGRPFNDETGGEF